MSDLSKDVRLHQWVPPKGPIRWEHCGVCGIIRRADKANDKKRCRGPVKVGPR